MRIAVLGSATSIHTIRWVNALAERGLQIHLISLHPLKHKLSAQANLHYLSYRGGFGYLIASRELRVLLSKLAPDLLNVHYASGYGTLGRLSNFKPILLSAWGSDIFSFPLKSPIHKWLVKRNLDNATAIASTSKCMAKAISKLTKNENIFETPFGIDEHIFLPRSDESSNNTISVGTVKSLERLYGIDTLLQAFALSIPAFEKEDVKLDIYGSGSEEIPLKLLANKLGISKRVTFHGSIPHKEVPSALQKLDVYLALSRSESFGVAILEASACEVPVIVSDAEGPSEVTTNNVTGIIVKKDSPIESSQALINLVRNKSRRKKLGKNGRKRVLNHYTWRRSIDTMISAFENTLKLYPRPKEQERESR